MRVETSGNSTRNALAAAIVFDLVGGRSRRIVTDTSWRWSPTASTGGTRSARRHSVALTEEYYPSDAQWLTDEPDGRSDDVRWSTFSKTLPRGVCAGVAPGPAKIPGVVAERCAATGAGTPRAPKWGTIAAAVLGTLTLLSLAAAIAALVLLWRVQRRFPPAGKADAGTEERATAKPAAVEGDGSVGGGDGSSGSGAGGGSGGGQGGGHRPGGGGSGKGGNSSAPANPAMPPFSSDGRGSPPFSPPAAPTEPSPWPTVSCMSTLGAPLVPPSSTHGQQLSDREVAAAAAAAATVVQRASGEQAAAAATQQHRDYGREPGSTISSAGPPPPGKYVPAYTPGLPSPLPMPPPPPMPISLLSPQSSVTGFDIASDAR